MSARRPLVVISGRVRELPKTDVLLTDTWTTIKLASEFGTSQTTPVDTPMTLAVPANTLIEVESFVFVRGTGLLTTVRPGIRVPASATKTGLISNPALSSVNLSSSVISGLLGASTETLLQMQTICQVGSTGGNITATLACNGLSSNAFFAVGSFLRWRPV